MLRLLYPIVMGLVSIGQYFIAWFYWFTRDILRALMLKELKRADIKVNKKNSDPWDLRIFNEKFYQRLATDQTLGLGEMYMEGWWECDRLDIFFSKIIRAGLFKSLRKDPWHKLFHYLQFDVFNLQTAARSWEVADKHYNLGNDLFKSFLDSSMNYSCGFWRDATNLEEAQQHKMELIGRKLKLKPGMRVLDIGCGWGGLCKFFAEKYNAKVVGITVSKEGATEAQERCKGLDVTIRVQDYRDVNEEFDRIVSVGMFEHVGRQNYRTYFEVANRCLKEDGIFLLHTIGMDNDSVPPIEPWMNKYIFPNGILPDHHDIPNTIRNIFTIEDWHNFGQDYDKTLMAWYANFKKNWHTISHLFKDQKSFYRMWTYYLQHAAGGFRSRRYQVWQIVLTKEGLPGGYISVR